MNGMKAQVTCYRMGSDGHIQCCLTTPRSVLVHRGKMYVIILHERRQMHRSCVMCRCVPCACFQGWIYVFLRGLSVISEKHQCGTVSRSVGEKETERLRAGKTARMTHRATDMKEVCNNCWPYSALKSNAKICLYYYVFILTCLCVSQHVRVT